MAEHHSLCGPLDTHNNHQHYRKLNNTNSDKPDQTMSNAIHHQNNQHDDDHNHHNHQHHHLTTLELAAADADHEHHERASSVTSDQYSSLNLSSVSSSAHHSPVAEHYHNGALLNQRHKLDEGAFRQQLTIATADEGRDRGAQSDRREVVSRTSSTGAGAVAIRPGSVTSSSVLSDYHGSLPCSPVESLGGSPPKCPVSDELLLLAAAAQHHYRRPSPVSQREHTSLNYVNRPASAQSETNNNNNNNHLHPDAHHQKTRSFSHSTSLSPLVVQAAEAVAAVTKSKSARGSPLPPGENQENSSPGKASRQQSLLLPAIVERPRRPSRIENRQSLHDLGYGRIESYFKLQRLGKGTYATVYMGRSRLSNDLVALKEILKEHDEGAPCTAIREVSLLRLLRHNNIVTLHDICHTPKKLTLVFEYVGPDLYAYMKDNSHLLSIHNVRLLLYQLLRGLAFCHAHQVLHRDLKPQNLLINSRGELKICDFGLARAKSIPTKSYSNEVVTLWYRPPDVLLGNTDYDHSIDMWGVGCIFYEMASGRTFFPGSSVRQQLYLIFSSLGAPSPSNWPEILQEPAYLSYSFPSFRPEKLAHRVPRLDPDGVQLMQNFLRFKPSERISADEARRDPFFASLPDRVHQLNERESIFDVPGVYMTLNPGQKLNNHHHHH